MELEIKYIDGICVLVGDGYSPYRLLGDRNNPASFYRYGDEVLIQCPKGDTIIPADTVVAKFSILSMVGKPLSEILHDDIVYDHNLQPMPSSPPS